jgi:hypothetical protein
MSANRLVPVVIALALGAAACSGGPKVSTSTSTSSPAAPPGAAASPGSGFRRGGLAGTVSSFDGATLVLATRQGGTVDVQTSGSTAVTRPVTGTVSDLVPDATVVVSGPLNADGTYAASTIVIGAPGAGSTLGGNRNGTPAPRQGAGSFGGARAGTAGTVKAVNGAAVVLTTAQGSTVTIVTSPSTVVTKTVAGTLSDLTPGESVTLTGSQNADGTYTATRIVIGGAAFGGFSGGGGGGGAATSPNTNNSPSSPGPTDSASPVTGA